MIWARAMTWVALTYLFASFSTSSYIMEHDKDYLRRAVAFFVAIWTGFSFWIVWGLM